MSTLKVNNIIPYSKSKILVESDLDIIGALSAATVTLNTINVTGTITASAVTVSEINTTR